MVQSRAKNYKNPQAARLRGFFIVQRNAGKYSDIRLKAYSFAIALRKGHKVSSSSDVDEVPAYANTIYYKTHELMGFIKNVRERDPDGIIVMFGDHLPFLGGNFTGYVESGVLTTNRSDFTPAMFKSYVSTPMIIIDGKRAGRFIRKPAGYQRAGWKMRLSSAMTYL